MAATYTNPVFERSFPDPFVLKFQGDYYAYCTGLGNDGRVFGVLRSRDMVNWNELGGAMNPLEASHPHYWAPEVTYHNGKFYLYYSVGNETLMVIRVAVSDSPEGVFEDSGRELTHEEFAIDPHIFQDSNGEWYMFYATDFLDHSHIGTGTVIDRMIDPFTLSGQPRPVTRARYDWQVYDPVRKEKGDVRWHTVEGPFVLKRKGLYYEMFSGGNWQNETYGVSFAASAEIQSVDEWEQFADGTTTLPVLRTIPGQIRGPGHNSVAYGPNNRELYCVYHRWNEAGRVLSIDRMDFSGPGRMFIVGPTDSPQPLPYPAIDLLASGSVRESNGLREISYDLSTRSGIRCYLGWRATGETGVFGVALRSGEIDLFVFSVNQGSGTAQAEWPGSGGARPVPIPSGFDASAPHDLILDIAGEAVNLILDGIQPIVSASLPSSPSTIILFSDAAAVEFGPLQITPGFEELFESGEILKRGWDNYGNLGSIVVVDGLLRMEGSGENRATLTRNVEPADYELCINLRFQMVGGDDARLTFGCGNMWTLIAGPYPALDVDGITFVAPAGYDPNVFHQFRSVRRGSSVGLFVDEGYLGSVTAVDGEFVRIMAQNVIVDVDMVRYTLIQPNSM